MTNPLLDDWDTPFGLPPFARIADADFGPAIEAAMAEGRANIAAIAEATEPVTFANTIEALEHSSATLDRVLSTFFGVSSADSNEAREALMRDVSPKLSAYSTEIFTNTALFARIEALWEARDTLQLTDEQARLLYLTHRRFVRYGARLKGAERDRFAQVMERLSVLGTQFSQNLLADERDWHLEVTEADLPGMPDYVLAAARAAGEERGWDGPAITLSRSLIVPFLQ